MRCHTGEAEKQEDLLVRQVFLFEEGGRKVG
jgi:hypothetical protein